MFISYCPQSGKKLCNTLMDLVTNLREYSYTVYYDELCEVEVRKLGGLDMWKEAHIRRAENILVICTPEYYQDDYRALMENKRSRIAVDRKLLRAITYSDRHDRLIPVLLDEYKNVGNCIPLFMQEFPLRFWPSETEDLMFCLARKAKFQLAEVRQTREVKSHVITIPPRPLHVPRVQPQQTQLLQRPMRERRFTQPTVIALPRAKEVSKVPPQLSKSQDKKGQKRFSFRFSRTNKEKKPHK